MARPSKGERLAFTMRLPAALAGRIKQHAPRDRQAWIVDAIERKLFQEGIDHGREARAETG